MPKYIIICDTRTTKVDWSEFSNPQEYELYLITDNETYAELAEKDQLRYMKKAVKVNAMESYELIKREAEAIIKSLEERGIQRADIRIVNNDELWMEKAAKLRVDLQTEGATSQQVLPFRDKARAKELLSEKCKEYLPQYKLFIPADYLADKESYLDHTIKLLGLPIFAKPTNLVGSVGTGIINSREELRKWCEKNQAKGNMELEEFIDGTLYHCDSIIQDGRIIHQEASRYSNPVATFRQGKLVGSIRLPDTDPDYLAAVEFNNRVLAELNPPDGTTHLEFFKTNDGRLIFLECAARSPGGMISEAYKIAPGINYHKLQYQLQAGVPVQAKFSRADIFTAWLFFPRIKGTFLEGFEPKGLTSQYQMFWFVKPGEEMQRSRDIGQPAGSIMLISANFEMLSREYEQLQKEFICYRAKPIGNPPLGFSLRLEEGNQESNQDESSDDEDLQSQYQRTMR